MYQLIQLTKFPGLFHAFSEKADGNMANSILGKVVDFDKTVANREKFLKNIGVDINSCVCMWVVHGDDIVEPKLEAVGKSMRNYNYAMKVDGLVTNKKGLYLFLLIADCLPIILYDPVMQAVGLVHAGWRGVDLEIAAKAVNSLCSKYESKACDIVAGIGPHVNKNSFVKEDPSQKNDPKWQPYLHNLGANKYQVDLNGYVKKQLVDVGIIENNIYVSDVNTPEDTRFFSHMRDKNLPLSKQGRFAVIVGLKQK